MPTFRRMIYTLIVIIVILAAAIVWISIDYGKARSAHREKVSDLNSVIATLLMHNREQLDKLKLSDELQDSLTSARVSIDREMLAMQHDLVDRLSKKGLID